MEKIYADYLVPNEDGTDYEQVLFSTDTSQVAETEDRKYVTNLQEDFLNKNLRKILTRDNLTNNVNEPVLSKVPTAQVTKDLLTDLNTRIPKHIEIVVGTTQPAPKNGKTIIWIDTSVGD